MDPGQNNIKVIHDKVKLLTHYSNCAPSTLWSSIMYDFSDEAYSNAQEIYAILKPMTAVGYQKIRLGGPNDGGYIFLDAFADGGIAYSFGISSSDPFSLAMVERGYDVWQYDGTINVPPYNNPHIHFNRVNISGEEKPQTNERNLRQIIEENGHQDAGDIILQCDIEDCEWAMLETVRTEELMKFTQISLEIHNFRPFGNEWQKKTQILRKLNETHQIIHIHANNCAPGTVLKNFRYLPNVFEVSYVHKNFCQFTECEEKFPTFLDSPCSPNFPDIFIGNFNATQKADIKEDLYSDILGQIFFNAYNETMGINRQLIDEIENLKEEIIKLQDNIFQEVSKLPRWLGNFLANFIPSWKKRREFKGKYVRAKH